MGNHVRVARLSILTMIALHPFIAGAHIVTPSSLEIMGIGKTATFTVTDPTGCTATMTAVPRDPAIISVSPARVERSVQQIYTVTALRAGDTVIELRWVGDNPPQCSENETVLLAVKVLDGPDLTIAISTPLPEFPSLDPMFRAVRAVRLGASFPLFTRITNQGPQPSIGLIFVSVLPPLLFKGEGRGFDSCNPARCQTSTSIPAGGVYSSGVMDLVVAEKGLGFLELAGEVAGGGDVTTSNNISKAGFFILGLEARAFDGLLETEDVRITTGRKRPGER